MRYASNSGRATLRRLFSHSPRTRSLRYEPLEDRRMLAVITVTTDQDIVDFNDGVTSLREAIFAANTVPGHHEIVFDFGHDGPATILLTLGELQITDDLTITGPGASLLTIDASGNDPTPDEKNGDGSRVFHVIGGSAIQFVSVELVGLRLTGGDSPGAGGAIYSSFTNLSLTDSVVEENSAAAAGGGVFVINGNNPFPQPDLHGVVLNRTTVANNLSAQYGGGIAVQGRALTVFDSTIQNNTVSALGVGALSGGGIHVANAEVEIDDSRIHGNRVENLAENATGSLVFQGGGGIFVQGGARIGDGNVSIHNSEISGNSTSGAYMDGGGIKVAFLSQRSQEVLITNSTISGNSTSGRSANGGGIFQRYGQLEISDSLVTGNRVELREIIHHTTYGGGGVAAIRAETHIVRSTISSNEVHSEPTPNPERPMGGGIALFGTLAQHSRIKESVISENSVEGSGGGIGVLQSTVAVTNTTISGNTATVRGGGIATQLGFPSKISHSTIVENRVLAEGQNPFRGGGVYLQGHFEGMTHSIVAQNYVGSQAQDVVGSFLPTYSLIGTNFGMQFPEAPVGSPDVFGNLIGGPVHGVIDPMLGPLADNGGPTLTHALLPGSPAIDAGDPALVAGVDGVPLYDQRGLPFTRVFGDRIDMGAVEAQSLVVDTLADEVDGDYSPGNFSLREAIALANQIGSIDTIEFSPALAGGTILLTMGELEITNSVEIIGLGAEQLTIDAQWQSRVINFVGDTQRLTLSGLTIANGRTVGNNANRDDTTFSGGAIRSVSNQPITLIDSVVTGSSTYGGHARGGGIFSLGRVQLIRTTIDGNSTYGTYGAGGGFFARRAATVIESTISNNHTYGSHSDGGGFSASTVVPSGGVLLQDSVVTGNSTSGNFSSGGGFLAAFGQIRVDNSIISNNRANRYGASGGGIHADRNLTVTGSTISGNSTGFSAGGIFVRDDLHLINSTVTDNRAFRNGGGLSVGGVLLATGSTIYENFATSAAGRGGGIFSSGHILLVQFTLSGNRANDSGGGIFHQGRANESIAIQHSTITLNVSNSDNRSGGPNQTPGGGSGGGIYAQHSSVGINHSIIAGNLDNSGIAPDVFGVVNTSFSLIGYGAHALGPLADNGGPTLTHALLPGSPAIDAGDPSLVAGHNGVPEYDQRGAPSTRVYDGRIDIGAVEAQPVFVTSADFNADGFVDGHDFLAWQRGFGLTEATTAEGDATGDGAVDGADLVVWEQQFGTVPAPMVALTTSEVEESKTNYQAALDAALTASLLGASANDSDALVDEDSRVNEHYHFDSAFASDTFLAPAEEETDYSFTSDEDDTTTNEWLAEELLEAVFA